MRTFSTPAILRAVPLLAMMLVACESSTSSDPRLEVVPGEARPFATVEVQGVPEAYQTPRPVDVTVGGQPTALVWDPIAEVHRMMVPQVPEGEAELVIPRPDGRGEVRADIRVLAPQYVGGSPAAAIAEMTALGDSLQIQSILGQRYISPQVDTILFPRLDALVSVTEMVQQRVAALSSQDAALAAAFYSENAAMMRELTGMLADMIAALASSGPSLALAPGHTGFQVAGVPASRVVQRCVDHVAQMEKLDRLQLWSLGITSALILAASAVNPVAGAAVAAISVKFMLALDLTALIAAAVPAILDDDGLRLEVAPSSVLHDGGRGGMRVYLVQQPSGSLFTAGISLGSTLRGAKESMEALIDLREGLRLRTAVWDVLKDFGLTGAIEFVERSLGDALDELAGGIYRREVLVTTEGVSLTGNSASGRWRFTGASTVADRALETIGRNSTPVEPVTLSASVGSSDDCRAQTSGSDPASGFNGFQIVTEGSVRFGAPPSATVTAGGQATLRVTATNEGGQIAQGITYRLASGTGTAWTPPAWLTVSAPVGPATLNRQASGNVSVVVSASSVAPQQTVIIPVQVLVAGKVTATTGLSVTVQPQLSDLVVNRQQSSIRLWDHGQQDGDLVTVTLNGTPIATSFSLTNAGTSFPVSYRPGRNVLVVRALNEGSISPNTASLGFANVVHGTPTQAYELDTGGTVQLTITYDPNAQQAIPANDALPAVQITRCEGGGHRDCRP